MSDGIAKKRDPEKWARAKARAKSTTKTAAAVTKVKSLTQNLTV
jgi:hypothetical protein